jgi:hypothetical protein
LMRPISTVRVGDSATTSFWFDNWTSIGALSSALPSAFSHCLAPRGTVANEFSGAITLARRDRVSPAATASSDSLKGHSSDSLPLPSLTSARLLGPLLQGFRPRTLVPS